MNQIINTVNTATMSSVELVSVINTHREKGKAELLHKNFIVKVENHPGIDSAKFLAQYKDSTGAELRAKLGGLQNLTKAERETLEEALHDLMQIGNREVA